MMLDASRTTTCPGGQLGSSRRGGRAHVVMGKEGLLQSVSET
jgi:hypothetical protein